MIRIGNVKLGIIPRIAITLGDEANMGSIQGAISAGADILELRIDQFKKLDTNYVVQIIKSIRNKTFPIIGTIRNQNEAEKPLRIITDKERLILYRDIIPLVDAVDIELQSKSILNKIVKAAHMNKKMAIVSYHNFDKTPKDYILEDLIKKAKSQGADIVKIATFAKNRGDVIRLMNVTQKNRAKNLITIALGSIGTISRIFFPLVGSLVTYTCIDKNFSPGQIQARLLQDELRFYYSKFNESVINRLRILESI